MDVPGFMVGTKVEEAGIIRHGAKMLYAVANATVPKITVVLRKAYGAGYYVMNGRAYEPDLIVAWPSAEISVMGAEGAVEIVMRRQVEEADDPAAKKAELIEAYRKIIDVYIAASNEMIDDVIDPRETRADDLPRRSRWPRASASSGRGSATASCRSERHLTRGRRRALLARPMGRSVARPRGVRLGEARAVAVLSSVSEARGSRSVPARRSRPRDGAGP